MSFAARRLGSAGTGLAATLVGESYYDVVISPTNAVAGVKVDADGSVYSLIGASYALRYVWKTGGGVVADYECRWTNTSGTLSAGTAGSWLALSGDREFSVTYTVDGAGSKSCTGTLEIRSASDLSVLASASVALSAVVDV